VEFDESNGSEGEVVGYDHIADEEVQEALKNMPIGDIVTPQPPRVWRSLLLATP
jgi:hypothetical protein